MIKTLILICSVTVPRSECVKATAMDVIRAEIVATPQQCIFGGMSRLAEIQDQAGFDAQRQYLRIECDRYLQAAR